MGVAFRPDPATSPGPGDYENGDGFDERGGSFNGTGRLKLSQSASMPAFSITSKGSLTKRMGKEPDDVPAPNAYS